MKKINDQNSNFHSAGHAAGFGNIKQNEKTNKIAKCKTEKLSQSVKKSVFQELRLELYTTQKSGQKP